MAYIRDANGEPVDLPMNENQDALPLSLEALAHLQNGELWIETAYDAEGRILVYNQPVIVDNEPVAIVQLSRSLADRDRSLQSLGIALLAGSVLTTLIAFGIGWTLSGITLRPIHRITQTVREIGQARDFVADVSHELRTPLTTIRGNLALLERTPALPQAEQEDILRDLISESERLSRLVSDLLALARADAGRKLELGPVDVGPLVEEACRQARILAPERTIDYELQNRIFDRFYRGDVSRSAAGHSHHRE